MTTIAFAALDTFSVMGGLQRFNRRVIACLSDLIPGSHVHLMRDTVRDLPQGLLAEIHGHGSCHQCFIGGVVRSSRRADILLLGHINLLPVGVLAKTLNRNLKLILFVHGDEVWNESVSRSRRWYEPFLLRFVDQIASVSDYTARTMAREFRVSPAKFVHFPNAVDSLSTSPSGPSENETVLVVTRLAAHDGRKHIDSVIRAFAIVARARPNARLEIVGDGILRPSLETLAQSFDLGDRIVFRGRVSDADLGDAYRRARLFVMPSNKEGFGIVFLEAWLRGLPVICGSEGASKEVIADGIDGIVADPLNINGLAEKIELLLSNRHRAREMGERGHEKVMSRYLDRHFRENLVKLLGSSVAC